MRQSWVFFVFVAILVATFATAPQQGFNSTCVNGDCYMRATTSLTALVASFVLAAFVTFYPQESGTPIHTEPVKIWERFAAFFTDFLMVMAVTSPITTIPILLAEAGATGGFEWSFERDFALPTDGALAGLGVAMTFAVLFGYFYVHSLIGRQTLGQYLLGFRLEGVAAADRKPAFAGNVILGYIGLCAWPVSVYLAANRNDKAFWWNLRTRTRLVRIV